MDSRLIKVINIKEERDTEGKEKAKIRGGCETQGGLSQIRDE